MTYLYSITRNKEKRLKWVITLKRRNKMREREELVEVPKLRHGLTNLAVSVHVRRRVFRCLLGRIGGDVRRRRRRVRFRGLRSGWGGGLWSIRLGGVLWRRRRGAEGGGAGDDVEKSPDVSHSSLFIVILCERNEKLEKFRGRRRLKRRRLDVLVFKFFGGELYTIIY